MVVVGLGLRRSLTLIVVLRLIVVILYDARRLRHRLRQRVRSRVRTGGTRAGTRAGTGTTGAGTGTTGAGAGAGARARSGAGSGLRIIRIGQIPLRLILCSIQFGGPLQEADDQTTLGFTEVVDHDAQIVNLFVDRVSKKGTEHAKGAAADLPLRSIRDRRTLVDGVGEATDLGGVGADEVGIYFEIRTGHR